MLVEEVKLPNTNKKDVKKLFDEDSSDISKDDSKIWSIIEGNPIDDFQESSNKQNNESKYF